MNRRFYLLSIISEKMQVQESRSFIILNILGEIKSFIILKIIQEIYSFSQEIRILEVKNS